MVTIHYSEASIFINLSQPYFPLKSPEALIKLKFAPSFTCAVTLYAHFVITSNYGTIKCKKVAVCHNVC